MSIGGPLASILAYFLPDWTYFSLSITLFSVAVGLFILLIPESPQWVRLIKIV